MAKAVLLLYLKRHESGAIIEMTALVGAVISTIAPTLIRSAMSTKDGRAKFRIQRRFRQRKTRQVAHTTPRHHWLALGGYCSVGLLLFRVVPTPGLDTIRDEKLTSDVALDDPAVHRSKFKCPTPACAIA